MDKYREVFAMAYELMKKYINVQPKDEYWEEFSGDINRLGIAFNDSELATDLLVAVNNELERIYNKSTI